MNASVLFLALRRMRAPLIVLIVIYAVSTLGLTLIPGVDAEGRPAPPMSFFHAFYFVSYTASTIGFGELPGAFSEAQRMWVTAVIFLSVIGWSYSIISLLTLVQDRGFQQVLLSGRFVRRVRHLGEPFFILCGCGETGLLIARALDRDGIRVVAIERSEARIQELELEDFAADLLVLGADAAQPQNLLLAGLQHRSCRGVPEIIAFSNQISYAGAIRPLRESNSTDIKPACVACRVQGVREGDNNRSEARRIIDTIKAMLGHPAYAGETIGVISMLGEAQALLIQLLLHQEIDGVEIANRRIQAGIPGEFQGDERDIIFLSLVDGPPREGLLRAVRSGDFRKTPYRESWQWAGLIAYSLLIIVLYAILRVSSHIVGVTDEGRHGK